jgi:hypothetical protein
MATINVDDHLFRAERHRKVGKALLEAEDEWSAVCYFYSAYHLVRYALRSDPIFEDLDGLQRINKMLTLDERTTERHRGRLGQNKVRDWGINELVVALYRPVSGAYHRLHQASVTVRYEEGLIPETMNRVSGSLDKIWEAHETGSLKAVVPPDTAGHP